MRLPRNPFSGSLWRTFRSSHMRECLAILPVIRRQLLETSRQVEESVVSVCGNFTGLPPARGKPSRKARH
jgi:hypothetical protein